MDFSWVSKFKLDPDPMRLEFQIALFWPKEMKFLKIGNIDYRNYRFEVWEERITRWLSFNEAFLFNWTDEETFDKLYELYKTWPKRLRARSKERLKEWFLESTGRHYFLEKEPEELDEGRFGGFFEKIKTDNNG